MRAVVVAGLVAAVGVPASAFAAGPEIGFAEQAAGGTAARGVLSGEVDTFDGVQSLWVAVRSSARSRDGFCRWWSPRLGRLTKRSSSCQVPEWMPAEVARSDTGFAWRVRLGGHPRHGHYVVIFRAVDGNGNVQRSLSDGRRRVGIDVGRRR
jgi:hypothetical protein